MPATPQWLIFLASQQDYGWFLGVVLWGGIVAVAWWLPQLPVGLRVQFGWLAGLQLAYNLVELGATAWPSRPTHYVIDAVQGALTALSYAALLLSHLWPRGRFAIRAIMLVVPALACAAWRAQDPMYGGLVWSLLGVMACVSAMDWRREKEAGTRPTPRAMGLCLLVALVTSPLGPLAYAWLVGRRDADLSPVVIPHQIALLASAAFGLSYLWREGMADRQEWRRALRAARIALAIWLVAGFFLMLWLGARVRQQHNARLQRQAENAAALLDRATLRECLGPRFQLGRTVTFYQPEGWPVETSHIPFAATAPFKRLSAQLHEIELVNPEADFIHVLTIRSGQLVAAATHMINLSDPYLVGKYGWAGPDDYDSLKSRETRITGPLTGSWGAIVSVRVPLFDGDAPQALGWFVIQYRVAMWRAAQAVDRFVIMGLVALGIVLWGLAVAYRLRNFEREAALGRAETAAEADRVKTLFLAKVSHELRTPLQAILGNAELAGRGSKPQEMGQRLETIRSQGALLERLVNDLLDLSAVQSGRFQLRPTPVDLAAVIGECLDAVANSAAAKKLDVRCTAPSSLPPAVEADGHRLRQILHNLLGNAVKYTQLGRIELTWSAEPMPSGRHRIQIIVRDTGPGIALHDQARLFEPFVRLEKHQHLAQGTGLGLSLVAGLVRTMGGRMLLESDGKNGTSIGCEMEFAAASPAVPDPAREVRPARVLVADDNALVRELLVTGLTQQGFDVFAAADGEEALAAFARDPFPAVILDISMPRLDGIETARQLRRNPWAAPHPWIIGLSAHAQEADIALAKAVGMDRFAVKPVELAVLGEMLAEGLAGRAPCVTATMIPLRSRFEEIFHREWPDLRARLHTALVQEDWAAFRQAAHYLKNSADVLGLVSLRLSCIEAEHAASLRDIRQVRPVWQRLEQQAEECQRHHTL